MGSLTGSALRQSSHQRFIVAHSADVGAVRRAVAGYAERLRADEAFATVAGQTATELATNLLRHAEPGGWMLTRPLRPDGVEILAVDRGPGIRDVAAAVAGGTPSPGGLGCGLAAVRRASSHFDLHSQPGRGTVVLAVVRAGNSGALRPPRRFAGVSIGIDEACGDGWTVIQEPNALTVAVVDGLGHGVLASVAADAALDALAEYPADLAGYLVHANATMRRTRGAAVAVCRLEPDHGELHCLSVGNISARLLHSGGSNAIVSFNGTVGMREAPPTAKIMRYPWSAGATLVMWSDGLSNRVDLAAEVELLTHDPAVAAAALHRDHTSDHDDATVVVVRGPDPLSRPDRT